MYFGVIWVILIVLVKKQGRKFTRTIVFPYSDGYSESSSEDNKSESSLELPERMFRLTNGSEVCMILHQNGISVENSR